MSLSIPQKAQLGAPHSVCKQPGTHFFPHWYSGHHGTLIVFMYHSACRSIWQNALCTILGMAGIMSVKWPVERKRTCSCHFLQEWSLRMTCCYNLLETSPGSLCRESGAYNWVFCRWFKNTCEHYSPSHWHIFYFLYFTSPYRDRVSCIWCGRVRSVNDYFVMYCLQDENGTAVNVRLYFISCVWLSLADFNFWISISKPHINWGSRMMSGICSSKCGHYCYVFCLAIMQLYMGRFIGKGSLGWIFSNWLYPTVIFTSVYCMFKNTFMWTFSLTLILL